MSGRSYENKTRQNLTGKIFYQKKIPDWRYSIKGNQVPWLLPNGHSVSVAPLMSGIDPAASQLTFSKVLIIILTSTANCEKNLYYYSNKYSQLF